MNLKNQWYIYLSTGKYGVGKRNQPALSINRVRLKNNIT